MIGEEYVRTMTVFEVLADPGRRNILRLLLDGELSVGALVDELALAQPNVSKHLRVLREAGFVVVRPRARERLYRLQPSRLEELDAWLAPFRAAWAERLDRLEAHLDVMED
jgi:DNA-binding transcriptional ArsR family regulator